MPLFGTKLDDVLKWAAAKDVKKLVGALKAPDAIVRRKAVEELARIRNVEVMKYCQENAQHKDRNVRWHVTQILGLIGTPQAMKILEQTEDPYYIEKPKGKKK